MPRDSDPQPASHATPDESPQPTPLLYGLEDRPRPLPLLLVAAQHLMAIIVPIITPALLICQALQVPARDTGMIISMSLLVSGLATFVQCWRPGPLGSGLLTIQGTSFNFLGPIIGTGTAMLQGGASVPGVLGAIFGTLMVGSFVEMGLSRILPLLRRVITPLVTGIVVLLIGLTLIRVGLVSMGGGQAALNSDTFATADNLLLSGSVLAVIVLLNRSRSAWVRTGAIIIALLVGYALAAWQGRLSFGELTDQPLFQWPLPLHYGLDFSWSLFIPLLVIYVVTSLEAIGDITATSSISREPVEGERWMRRIRGGVLANGFGSLVAGALNSFPSSTFAQNNGVIQLTGVASRYVGMMVAVMLVILGLLPPVSGVIRQMPEPVLGGATIVMFGSVAAAGINILAGVRLDRRALLILAISLAMGLGVAQVPQFLQHLPDVVANVFSSGVATGGLTAMILNLVLPEEPSS
ncbi:xanthine permease XanP [Kushneria sinocarnis]|uniref:Xanthine permease XanP n=1 Tax=Kushneria sinocarnis TaxID=595502 RepID=A0A420WV91_9GAMM|nr:nucleobase:cation symporter-2 family protein [Kushneria sinocarnis]RKR02478.1 xanthine permease XanP [Kushneria sinocarnis]